MDEKECPMGANRVEQPDRIPKSKMSKAERRELQEKQRAAKAAKSLTDGHGPGVSGSTGTKLAHNTAPPPPSGSGRASSQVINLMIFTTM